MIRYIKPNKQDISEQVGDYYFNPKENMQNGLFKLDWANVRSAVVYGILTIVVCFVLSVVESIVKAGSIFGLDWHKVIDGGVLSSLSFFVVILSLVKNLLTTDKGNFLGITKVVSPT